MLYGTDALSGTINIITNRPRVSNTRQFTIGFDGFYSSNEDGRRGTVTLGASDRRWAVSFTGGARAVRRLPRRQRLHREFRRRSSTNGTLVQTDTADTNFGFNFKAFPEGFNAPFTRSSAMIPRSGMEGSTFNLAAVALVRPSQELTVRYQRRHASDIGFPDFEPPSSSRRSRCRGAGSTSSRPVTRFTTSRRG